MENQAAECPRLLILGLVMSGDGEVLLAISLYLLSQHLILIRLPRVQALCDPLLDGLCSRHVMSPMHNH